MNLKLGFLGNEFNINTLLLVWILLLAFQSYQQYKIVKILELKVEQYCFVYPPDVKTGFKKGNY